MLSKVKAHVPVANPETFDRLYTSFNLSKRLIECIFSFCRKDYLTFVLKFIIFNIQLYDSSFV